MASLTDPQVPKTNNIEVTKDESAQADAGASSSEDLSSPTLDDSKDPTASTVSYAELVMVAF